MPQPWVLGDRCRLQTGGGHPPLASLALRALWASSIIGVVGVIRHWHCWRHWRRLLLVSSVVGVVHLGCCHHIHKVAISTCVPPCEQWLSTAGAGAGLILLLGQSVVTWRVCVVVLTSEVIVVMIRKFNLQKIKTILLAVVKITMQG
jgi:hypothetical protein